MTLTHVSRFALAVASMSGIFYSCQNEPRIDLAPYYFDYQSLQDGKVYQYRTADTSIAPTFWYYKSIKTDTGYALTATNYDSEGRQRQVSVERVAPEGTLLSHLRLFEYDSAGRVYFSDAKILKDNQFPFSVADTGSLFIYKIKYQSALVPSVSYTLLRNRIFKGFETFIYKEKEYHCAIFETISSIYQYDTTEGGIEIITPSAKELYAEGIGLIYFERSYKKDQKMSFYLENIMTMAEFELKFYKKFQKNE